MSTKHVRHEIKERRKRADKIGRKIKRRQTWRQKTIKLQKRLGKKLRKRLDGLLEALSHQLKALHKDLHDVEKRIDELKKKLDTDGRKRFLAFLESNIGLAEDDPKRIAMALDMGADPDWPWCSILVGYGLKHFGGFDEPGDLPAGVPYSGSWLTWKFGQRVSYSEVELADLLIFDWGDGGLTDHIATYVGNGQKIGGNENDRVEKDAVPVANIVGVIRPRWNH
jgi:hypothetical protein